ncbi:FtsX-like permease family protein [Sandaracinobacter sp. RS1-74]|uniref:ABC transporter permease n=1 Tax=Sandaracinobacteroides sayramensis TaxID=2913411 RepID=UPI001EDB85B8|nr:FtsX-like permease family protein [Sandaracinobacteroides sayramensis]MCG2841423.1 FtsX-like permease family protein [Sandaracinobacteroides sayramensis]
MNVSTLPVASGVSPQPPGWPMAARLAWREVRGGLGGLRLLFACLLLGVLAMAGVGSLGSSIASGLAGQGQVILGGDVEARLTQREPLPEEMAALKGYGGAVSTSVRMRAMVRGETGAAANRELLGELKAVDGGWPLYGKAEIKGGGEVQAALAEGAVVGEALADQMGLTVGDMVGIGEAKMPVAAILTVEPDRAGEGFAFGPSVLISTQKLAETGLIQPGSLYRFHVRLKLPEGMDPAFVREDLDARFPEAGWRLADRRDGAPGVRRFVERLAQFLTLVSLTALAVAGVGVGNGVQSYLDRKAGSIATLKALGAPTRLIRRAYLLLVGGVALAAAVVGAGLGALVPYAVVAVAGDALPVPPALGLHPWPLLAAVGFGLLVAFAFAVAPLARASALPAQRMFRGSVEAWPWPSGQALAAALGAGAVVAALAVWQAAEKIFALGFLGGAAAVLALLFALGTLVKWGAARLPRPSGVLPRLALANVHRPGAMTRQLVVALGLGLSLFATLAFIETSFNAELQRTVPAKAPAFFLLDLPKEERPRFVAILPDDSEARLVPSLRGPVVAVNGVPASEIKEVPEGSYVLRGDRGLTFADELPPGNRLVAGKWWPKDYAGPPLVSMDAEQAGLLGLEVGDSITVSVLGVEIEATIASLREVDWDSMGFNFVLIYDPATLRDAPYTYMATVSPPDAEQGGFTGMISRAFPTVSVIKVRDVLGEIGTLVNQMGTAVRAAASVAILAGIAVLVGALASQAKARTLDNVILKTLGATRRQLMAAAAMEYAALGLLVSGLALALGGLSGWIVVTQVLKFGWAPDWGVALATVLAGAAATLLLGLAGAWRTLGAKVARVLREV